MMTKPGVNGPKSWRYWGSVEKLMTEIVRPWKLFWQAMISAWLRMTKSSSAPSAQLSALSPPYLPDGSSSQPSETPIRAAWICFASRSGSLRHPSFQTEPQPGQFQVGFDPGQQLFVFPPFHDVAIF
jgi:hypothetical protein